MTDTPAPAEALSLTFFSGDLNQDITVQGYLQRLLSDLWQKEESFNGKRPFGNSGWQWEVYGALIEAGHIPGEIDEDGCIEDVDEQAGEAFVLSLIGQMGTAALARAEVAECDIAGAHDLIDKRTKIVRHLPGEPETIQWRVDALTNLAEKYRGSLSTMTQEAREWRDRAKAAEAEGKRLREGMWLIVYVNTDLTDDSPHPEIMEFGGRWNPDAVQEMLDTIKEDVPRDLQRDVFYRLPVSRETSDAYGSEGMPYHTPEWDDRERVEFCNVCHALLTPEQAHKVPMDEHGGAAVMCATHALAGSPS